MAGMLEEGAVFAGRYHVVRCIAAGGMGAVYEVIHLETERRRALKVMHPHILQQDDMRERFKLEAKVAAHIESDFIVDVFDAGIDEPTRMPFLVMELLRGEDLGKRLKRSVSFLRKRLYSTCIRQRWRSTRPTRRRSCTGISSPRTCSLPSGKTTHRE